MPGYDIKILDNDGNELSNGELGSSRYKNCHFHREVYQRFGTPKNAFKKSYLATFPGFYETGDAGLIDDEGYLYIMAQNR